MTDPTKYPAMLEELAGIIAASLIEDSGMPPERAAVPARGAVERLRRSSLAGLKVYIPRGKSYETERMRREIGERWDGRNTRELCKEFGISETWLRELYDQSQGKFTARRAVEG